MARRSLKPHLNQIRTWVRQGRTDAWIAHQLEVTVQQIDAFKRENELAPADENGADAVAVDFDDEIDLRAEDDALWSVLAQTFYDAHWTRRSEVYIAHSRAPDRVEIHPSIEEIEFEDLAASEDTFIASEPWGRDPEVRAQFT